MRGLLRVAVGGAGWWLLFAHLTAGQEWKRLGPEGGEVISLASRGEEGLLLGTADGHVFASSDGGTSWNLRGHASNRWDAVVQAMLVDRTETKRVFAGVWFQDGSAGGGVFASEDGGASWKRRGLEGEVVRALALWDRDPKVMVAGTRSGVFRTKDAGRSWERISPAGDDELKNLDSIAMDRGDSDVIYAGTYHLPWKTTDGGKHWTAIADGMIDDSDIMSIAIDTTNPARIFASACSGVYRSESGGKNWTKLAGIPYNSRRTQQILQDERNPSIWFAATTEGLWKSSDHGENWERVLGRSVAANALAIDGKSGRLIVGTDTTVLVESGRGEGFVEGPRGFAHRVLGAAAANEADGNEILVATDAPENGMLASFDAGSNWKAIPAPKSPVLRLFSAQNRWIAGLQGSGAVFFDEKAGRWREFRFMRRRKAGTAKKTATIPPHWETVPSPEVIAVRMLGARLFLGTSDGLWSGSVREGVLRPKGLTGRQRILDIASGGEDILVLTENSILESRNGGDTWASLPLPTEAGKFRWLRRVSDGEPRILLGTENGVFLGAFAEAKRTIAWRLLQSGLPVAASRSGFVTEGIWAATTDRGTTYASVDEGANWERIESEAVGPVRKVLHGSADRLYLETRADGVVMVELGRRDRK